MAEEVELDCKPEVFWGMELPRDGVAIRSIPVELGLIE
jgi:hypothetical protein